MPVKKLQFRAPFGNFKTGDVIETEDDAVFDTLYLTEAPDAKVTPAKSEPRARDTAPSYGKKDAK